MKDLDLQIFFPNFYLEEVHTPQSALGALCINFTVNLSKLKLLQMNSIDLYDKKHPQKYNNLKSLTSSTSPSFPGQPEETALLRCWHQVSTGWGNWNMPLRSGQHGLLTASFSLPTTEYVLDVEANTSRNCKIQHQEEEKPLTLQGPKSTVLKF